MSKKKNSKQAETSLMYFSIAASLSLLSMTPKTVKADETVPSSLTKQTVAGKNSANNKVASPKSTTNDQPKVNTPETPQFQDSTPNPSLDTFKWGSLDVTYSNHVVTVPGDSVTQSGSMAYINGINKDDIQEVKFTGQLKVNSAAEMFRGLSNLTKITGLKNLDTSDTIDMRYMFTDCSNLKELDLSSFVIDPGIDKGYMLNGLTKLNTLKLGKSTHINESYLDTPGTWVSVGNGTEDAPQATQKLNSNDLASQRIDDTYIRPGAAIKAFYLDTDGKSIADETSLNGKIGNSYKLTPKTIPGYVIKEIPANATGFFTDQPQSVKFIYSAVPVSVPSTPAVSTPIKAANVIVHYQDERGNKLAPDTVLQGNVGDGYITSLVEIAGYTLKTRPENATGFYNDQNQDVTYIYTKNATGLSSVTRTVFHNSYVYDENGVRKKGEYFAGETVKTYSTKLIQGKKYYDLGNNDFIKAVNITGVTRKLKHNAYLYTKKAKRLGRKVLKKKYTITTYGGAIKINHKLYYIVGKNRYIKKANF